MRLRVPYVTLVVVSLPKVQTFAWAAPRAGQLAAVGHRNRRGQVLEPDRACPFRPEFRSRRPPGAASTRRGSGGGPPRHGAWAGRAPGGIAVPVKTVRREMIRSRRRRSVVPKGSGATMINVGPAKILGKRVRRPLDGKSTRAGAARGKEGEAGRPHSINPFVKYFPL